MNEFKFLLKEERINIPFQEELIELKTFLFSVIWNHLRECSILVTAWAQNVSATKKKQYYDTWFTTIGFRH